MTITINSSITITVKHTNRLSPWRPSPSACSVGKWRLGKKQDDNNQNMANISVHHRITKRVLRWPVHNRRMSFTTVTQNSGGNLWPHTSYCGMFFMKFFFFFMNKLSIKLEMIYRWKCQSFFLQTPERDFFCLQVSYSPINGCTFWGSNISLFYFIRQAQNPVSPGGVGSSSNIKPGSGSHSSPPVGRSLFTAPSVPQQIHPPCS